MRNSVVALGFLALLAGCSQNGDQGRPCDNGTCLPGYVCNSSNICVVALDGAVGGGADASAPSLDAALSFGNDAGQAGADAGQTAANDAGVWQCVFDKDSFDNGCVFGQ